MASSTRKTSARKGGRKKATTAAPAATEVQPRQRQQHPNRTGAVGTAAKPSPEAEALRRALNNARKSGNFTFKDSIQPELLLQSNGRTVVYVVQREGSKAITARTPSNQTLNVKDIGGSVSLADAVKQILAHMDARAKAGVRGTRQTGNGGESLSNSLTESVRRTPATRKKATSGGRKSRSRKSGRR